MTEKSIEKRYASVCVEEEKTYDFAVSIRYVYLVRRSIARYTWALCTFTAQ